MTYNVLIDGNVKPYSLTHTLVFNTCHCDDDDDDADATPLLFEAVGVVVACSCRRRRTSYPASPSSNTGIWLSPAVAQSHMHNS